MSKPAPAPSITRQELVAMLPAVISDLKHHNAPARRLRTNANIRHDLYFIVVLKMNQPDCFGHEEPVENGRGGLFIKGYVRDVWSYLHDAYDLIHGIDFEHDYAELMLDTNNR